MTREELDLFYDKVQADVKTLTEEYNKIGDKRTYNFWLGCTAKDKEEIVKE